MAGKVDTIAQHQVECDAPESGGHSMAARPKKPQGFPRLTALFNRAVKSGTSERIATWFEHVGSAEYIAFLVYLFDSQIGRGGFQFWILNEYVKYDAALLDLISGMKVRHGDEVRDLIRETGKIAKRAAELELKDGPAADAALDRLARRLDQMDEKYAAIREEFLSDVEKFLSNMTPQGKRKAGKARIGSSSPSRVGT
jgi:hypothetical protein